MIVSFRNKALRRFWEAGETKGLQADWIAKVTHLLDALGLPVMAAAKALGISRQTLHRILSGTASITPEMALRIGKLLGNGPGLWLKMQMAHDLWHAERKIAQDLAAIETRAA
jgi:antitoxin HigA-1